MAERNITRIIGAFIALAGGALALAAGLMSLEYVSFADEVIVASSMTFAFAAVGLLGGVLLLLGKRYGGLLAIIAGGMLIVGFWIDLSEFVPLAFHWANLTNTGFYIDPLLLIGGGIVGLAAR